MVCRSVGRGSCTADFQQLPLSITVALSAQVRIGSSRLLCQLKEAQPNDPLRIATVFVKPPKELIKKSIFLKGAADGELYMDDGHSFSYRDRKAFCLRSFRMQSGRLTCWSVVTHLF